TPTNIASPFEELLAWTEGLQATPREALSHVIPHPPREDDILGWVSLASHVRRLYGELQRECVNFEDVRDSFSRTGGFSDEERWSALEKIRLAYEESLDRAGLVCGLATRLQELEQAEIEASQEIILI